MLIVELELKLEFKFLRFFQFQTKLMETLGKKVIPDGISEEQWNEMGLLEKCKLSYSKDHVVVLKKRWPSQAAVGLFWYTAVTQLYSCLFYIIPELLIDLHPMNRYYLKVIFTIVIIQGCANWLCVKCYGSVYKPTADNPDYSKLTDIDYGISDLQLHEKYECDDFISKIETNIRRNSDNGVVSNVRNRKRGGIETQDQHSIESQIKVKNYGSKDRTNNELKSTETEECKDRKHENCNSDTENNGDPHNNYNKSLVQFRSRRDLLAVKIIRKNELFERLHRENTGLVWGYCSICVQEQPPRAHHCKVCNVCVLKRDHHCFFTDNCVGFYNQRYFVVLNAYIMIACIIGLIGNIMYLRWKFDDLNFESSVWNYCLPNVIYHCIYSNNVPLYICIMVSHLWIMPLAGALALGLFIGQIGAITAGKTAHEMSNPKHNVKSIGTMEENFRSVFGALWGLNFLFPAVILFRQEGDGIHWKNIKKE